MDEGVTEKISSWPPSPPATDQVQQTQNECSENIIEQCRETSSCEVTEASPQKRSLELEVHPDSHKIKRSRAENTALINDASRMSDTDQLPDGHTDDEKCRVMKTQAPKSETLANVALARWWRTEGRRMCGHLISGPSTNPNTLLKNISRLPKGREFLLSQARKLKKQIREDARVSASVYAALGSYQEKLQQLEDAKNSLEKAVALDSDNKEYRWLLVRVKKQLAVATAQTYLMPLLPEQSSLTPSILADQTVCVDRRAADSLSLAEFLFRYAGTSTPVIITGLVTSMTTRPWDMDHIKQVAGGCSVTPKRLVLGSVEWAQLEDVSTTTVGEFIDSIQNSQSENYLFDWGLPLHCPSLAEELTIPKYFSNDFLQRMRPGSLYKDSWPSLFIAPRGLVSELHVDAFGSNFWMALFEGEKRWTFFYPHHMARLYPRYESSMDPVFEVNLADPDLSKHPLLSLTTPRQCVLKPGEVLFVPAGCPHRVENLTPSFAISANYVDKSNFDLVKEELKVNALVDPRAEDLLSQFLDPSFNAEMNSDLDHQPWENFKHGHPQL